MKKISAFTILLSLFAGFVCAQQNADSTASVNETNPAPAPDRAVKDIEDISRALLDGSAGEDMPICCAVRTYKARAIITVINTEKYEDIKGMTQNLTLESSAHVIVSVFGSLETLSHAIPGSGADVAVFLDGKQIPGMQQTVELINESGHYGEIHPFYLCTLIDLPPGNHTFRVMARKFRDVDFYAGGNTTVFTAERNEGMMTLMVFEH